MMNGRHIEIVQGNDYIGGRSLTAVGNGWGSDIVAARLLIWATNHCNDATPVIDLLGTFTPATINSSDIAMVGVPRAETLKLMTGVRAYQYEFKGLTKAGCLVTLERGLLTVLRGGL